MKGWYKALEDLVWLTQLGLNMLLPLVMCLGGAWWAVNSWSWPEWVFLSAILLGLASGAQNFWYFAKEHLDRAKKEIWTAPGTIVTPLAMDAARELNIIIRK